MIERGSRESEALTKESHGHETGRNSAPTLKQRWMGARGLGNFRGGYVSPARLRK
jgi:hypothetical protein